MKKLIYLFALAVSLEVSAQQDPAFSQYWVNSALINPAHTGVNGNTSLNLTSRYQWVGIEGAPQTHTLGFMTKQAEGVGLGGSYLFDRIGPVMTNTLNIDVAYHFQMSEGWSASMGARLTGSVTQLNLLTLTTAQKNDPVFIENLNSGFRPNVGFGFLVHNDHFYVGYGEPRAIDYDMSIINKMNARIISHRYVYTGYNFDLPNDLQLRPSLLFKQVRDVPIQMDVNIAAEYMEKFSGGLAYRTGDGMGVLLGFAAMDKLRFYYCYDIPFSPINVATIQTHQVTIVYDFKKKENGKPLRFFD